jgi:hypothetical protein
MTHDIQTRAQYEAAMSELSALMDEDPAAESPAGLRLSSLANALEAWERVNYPHLYPDQPSWLEDFNRAWLAVPIRYRVEATHGEQEPEDETAHLVYAVHAMARDLNALQVEVKALRGFALRTVGGQPK